MREQERLLREEGDAPAPRLDEHAPPGPDVEQDIPTQGRPALGRCQETCEQAEEIQA